MRNTPHAGNNVVVAKSKVKLSAKKEKFCQEYVIDYNMTQAAIRAGYSVRTARQQGSRLLMKVDVVARVRELQRTIGLRLEVSQERVLKEFAKIAFTDLTDVVDISTGQPRIRSSLEIDPVHYSAISEVVMNRDGLRIKMYDKKAALDSLAKYLGMHTDGMDLSNLEGQRAGVTYWVEFVSKEKKKGVKEIEHES